MKKLINIIKNKKLAFAFYIVILVVSIFSKLETYKLCTESLPLVLYILSDILVALAVCYTTTFIIMLIYSANKKKYVSKHKDLPRWLYNIDEINIDEGVKLCGGESNYINTLENFAKCAETHISEISEAVNKDDIEMLTIKVHALKSSSGLIGADKLSAKAKKMEEECKNSNKSYIQKNISSLIHDYSDLVEELQPIISTEKTTIKGNIDRADLPELYKHLKSYVESFNDVAIGAMLNSLGSYEFPPEEKEKYNKLVKAYELIDWQEMMNILEND